MGGSLYIYKLVADGGGAPCVWRGLLSLAICKPKIRKNAAKGEIIFGFGGKNYGERLIYIAKVTAKLDKGDYYRKRQYVKRPDCIYRNVEGKPRLKRHVQYHKQSDQRRRDVGMTFENAYVLLSSDFRYFGRKGTDEYKHDFPAIAALVEGLTRGHRVNHSTKLRRELLELKKQVWRKHRRMKIGPPTDTDRTRLCNSDSPSVQCES